MEQSNPSTIIAISGMIISVIGTLLGVIITQHYIRKSTERQIFAVAADKFRAAMMPFYNEVCEMATGINDQRLDDNNIWSFRRMPQIISKHRKIIDEFRFSIPIKYRHSFDVIADSYCPPQTAYTEDQIKTMYWSDESMEREIQIRKDIKNNIENMMKFNI
jgi:hypothetical protein